MKKQKIFIQYHANSAIIKSQLSRLPKEQLIVHGRYIRTLALKSFNHSNRRGMYIELYNFCKHVYLEKYR